MCCYTRPGRGWLLESWQVYAVTSVHRSHCMGSSELCSPVEEDLHTCSLNFLSCLCEEQSSVSLLTWLHNKQWGTRY